MNEIEKIPKDYHSITPVLIVKNGDEAIEFYKNGFGVEERCRMKAPDGRVAHAGASGLELPYQTKLRPA